MKAATLSLIALASCAWSQSIEQAQQVHVTIMTQYTGRANTMFIRGNACGLSWSKGWQMRPSGSPFWKMDLMCDPSESNLEFKVLIDDQVWMIGANAVTPIKETVVSIYPWFYNTEGTLKVFKNVWSPQLNNNRDVIVYLPPSYTENTLKTYSNVLVMHDGNNLFDPNTAFMGNSWLIQDTLDPMIYQGQIEEVIVIGAYNTGDRMNEYTYSFDKSEGFGGKGDLYLDWIEQTLLPFAKSQLRIELDKGGRLGIMGSSLGGLISCYAGWTRPAMYGRVGCMSSSFWWNDQDFQKKVLPAHQVPPLDRPRFYMDAGTEGGEASCRQFTGEIEQYLTSKQGYISGFDVKTFVDQGGQHSEYYWGRRFSEPMGFLYPTPAFATQRAHASSPV